MRASGWIIALAGIAILGGCQESAKLLRPGFSDGEVRWGEAAGGLQAGIAKRTYELGREPAGAKPSMMFYVLSVRNVSARPVKFLWPGNPSLGEPEIPLAGNESVKIAVTVDAEGGAKSTEFKPAMRPLIRQMEAGEVKEFELRLAPKGFGMEKFGEGKVWAAYSNQQGEIDYGEGYGGKSTGIWVGEIRAGF